MGPGEACAEALAILIEHAGAPLPRAGHVDNFCCFIAPGVVALAWPNDENDFNDPQWEISIDAYERLSNTTGTYVF